MQQRRSQITRMKDTSGVPVSDSSNALVQDHTQHLTGEASVQMITPTFGLVQSSHENEIEIMQNNTILKHNPEKASESSIIKSENADYFTQNGISDQNDTHTALQIHPEQENETTTHLRAGRESESEETYLKNDAHRTSETPGSSEAAKPPPPVVVSKEPEKKPIAETIFFIIFCLLAIITLPFSLFFCLAIMQEYERAVILRFGRLRRGGPRGPGVIWYLPCCDTFKRIDLRTKSFDVPPQEVLTRDSVSISLDAVVYYRVHDPTKCTLQVVNFWRSTELLAQTTLRNIAGTKMLTVLLTDKETISRNVGAILDAATDAWGITVERVEIKDVRLPQALQRAMAAEAEAQREARAKIVAAEGEKTASTALKEASDVIAGNPIALQLRYLQTLQSIAADHNKTVIFPLPTDLLRGMMSK